MDYKLQGQSGKHLRKWEIKDPVDWQDGSGKQPKELEKEWKVKVVQW